MVQLEVANLAVDCLTESLLTEVRLSGFRAPIDVSVLESYGRCVCFALEIGEWNLREIDVESRKAWGKLVCVSCGFYV